MKEKIVAIIPARGGSKRVPRKNIRNFHGKPMIAWAIAALRKLDMVQDILVSTDDEEIKKIAMEHGAQVPFIRPRELSDDHTGVGLVIRHAVDWYIENVTYPDMILTVYATAVFLSPEDIIAAWDLMQKSGSRIVFSGTEYPFPIQRALFMTADNRVQMFHPENLMVRSQDLVKAYHDAGQFYLSKTEAILNNVSCFSDQASMLVLPRYRVVDIDTLEDIELAEKLFAVTQQGM